MGCEEFFDQHFVNFCTTKLILVYFVVQTLEKQRKDGFTILLLVDILN